MITLDPIENEVIFYSEGFKICGDLLLPYAGSPCVIMSHGLASDKDGDKWPRLARKLADEGIASLRFTHRGCGWGNSDSSEGFFEDTTLSGRIADFRAAVDFLKHPDVNVSRLGAVGSSFGGMVVLGAQDPRIEALALLATPHTITNTATPKQDGPSVWRIDEELWINTGIFQDLDTYDLAEIISRYSVPILIIHGKSDDVVPIEHAQRLHEATARQAQLITIPNGDHVFSEPRQRARVLNLCTKWFKANLGSL